MTIGEGIGWGRKRVGGSRRNGLEEGKVGMEGWVSQRGVREGVEDGERLKKSVREVGDGRRGNGIGVRKGWEVGEGVKGRCCRNGYIHLLESVGVGRVCKSLGKV